MQFSDLLIVLPEFYATMRYELTSDGADRSGAPAPEADTP
jgi:hypothetical protein